MADRMSNEEYLDTQLQLTTFSAMLIEVDVEGFIERGRQAEAAAPLIDPSAFLAGHEKLAAITRLAEAALRFKQAALEFRNTMQRLDASASRIEAAKKDGPR